MTESITQAEVSLATRSFFLAAYDVSSYLEYVASGGDSRRHLALPMRAAADLMKANERVSDADIFDRAADQLDPPVAKGPAKPDLTTKDGWFAELDRANSGPPTGWPGMTAPGTAAELKALRSAWLHAEAGSDAQMQLACLYTLHGQDQFEDF